MELVNLLKAKGFDEVVSNHRDKLDELLRYAPVSCHCIHSVPFFCVPKFLASIGLQYFTAVNDPVFAWQRPASFILGSLPRGRS